MTTEKTLPKVIFKQMPLKLETEMFLGFLSKGWGKFMQFKITDKFPQFLEIKEGQPEETRKKVIKNEIVKIRKGLGKKMNNGLLKVKTDWQKVEDKTLRVLSEIIQTDYLKKEVTAYVSINPICPRWLDSWSFSVPPDHNNPNKVIAHEISHFLFFKKIKEVLPEIDKKKYNSPHKEWILSEIVAVIILDDKRMTSILDTHNNGYYPNHRELKINGQFLTKIIEDLYEKSVVQNNDFAEFLRESIKIINTL